MGALGGAERVGRRSTARGRAGGRRTAVLADAGPGTPMPSEAGAHVQPGALQQLGGEAEPDAPSRGCRWTSTTWAPASMSRATASVEQRHGVDGAAARGRRRRRRPARRRPARCARPRPGGPGRRAWASSSPTRWKERPRCQSEVWIRRTLQARPGGDRPRTCPARRPADGLRCGGRADGVGRPQVSSHWCPGWPAMGDEVAGDGRTRASSVSATARRCARTSTCSSRCWPAASFDVRAADDRDGDRAQPGRRRLPAPAWPTPRCWSGSPTRTTRPSSAQYNIELNVPAAAAARRHRARARGRCCARA